LFDQLARVAIFFKINMRLGYHQLKIKKDNASKPPFEHGIVTMGFGINV